MCVYIYIYIYYVVLECFGIVYMCAFHHSPTRWGTCGRILAAVAGHCQQASLATPSHLQGVATFVERRKCAKISKQTPAKMQPRRLSNRFWQHLITSAAHRRNGHILVATTRHARSNPLKKERTSFRSPSELGRCTWVMFQRDVHRPWETLKKIPKKYYSKKL